VVLESRLKPVGKVGLPEKVSVALPMLGSETHITALVDPGFVCGPHLVRTLFILAKIELLDESLSHEISCDYDICLPLCLEQIVPR
jgi:hypothetical protein